MIIINIIIIPLFVDPSLSETIEENEEIEMSVMMAGKKHIR